MQLKNTVIRENSVDELTTLLAKDIKEIKLLFLMPISFLSLKGFGSSLGITKSLRKGLGSVFSLFLYPAIFVYSLITFNFLFLVFKSPDCSSI